ncbi:MAG: aromatic amino acid transport family protein [Gammaproteobacteria bacterium]
MLKNHFLGAALLVAGTAIGAGMLALPVTTAQYGLYPSITIFIVCWVLMTIAALLMLEVNLWLPEDTNLISMARKTLGIPGAVLAWISYLLLLYALLSAYTTGLGSLSLDVMHASFGLNIPNWAGVLFFIVIGAGFIYAGTESVDRINRILLLGLFSTFMLLIFALTPNIHYTQLTHAQFQHIWLTLPVIFTTFGFQIIIPTIRSYLNSDVVPLRKAIIVGSVFPLATYIIWQILILGVVPIAGEQGLNSILQDGQPEVGLSHALAHILQIPWINIGFRCFASFAIATSFLGVSLSLFDFLADGLHVRKKITGGRIINLILTFTPPLFFALIYPRGFILALQYAGIFVAILLVFMPAAMAWSGRYYLKLSTAQHYRVFGGKWILAAVIVFALITIWIDTLARLV